MSVKSLWTTFTDFLNKHTDDLRAIASALSGVNNALPIDAQDKARINKAINTVDESITNINEWLAGAKEPGAVTIKQSDIMNALNDYFNSDIGMNVLKEAVGNIAEKKDEKA